jgi:DNA polymerase III alpha subunit
VSPYPYVELHAHSGFSFLDGASHPEELVLRARELGYPGLALTDPEPITQILAHIGEPTSPPLL